MRRLLLIVLLLPTLGAKPTPAPVAGLAEREPAAFALVGADVHVRPGEVIEDATLVIRDGKVTAVGAGTEVPQDARRVDADGRVIYAGFIEPYSTVPVTTVAPSGYWSEHVRPHVDAADAYAVSDKANAAMRGQGIVARLLVPEGGVVRGAGSVVSTGDGSAEAAVLRRGATQHLQLTPQRRRGGERSYPTSPMGAFALVRQAFYDASWYEAANAAVDADGSLPRPAASEALAALQAARDGGVPFVVDAPDELYLLRGGRIGREFTLPVVLMDEGRAYQRLEDVAGLGVPVIASLDFPEPPDVTSPQAAASASLRELMHWDLAPENPGRLHEADVRVALSGHGLEKQREYLPAVRRSVERGLHAEAALAAVTLEPATILGVDDTLGTIEPGKAASFVVADGDLFTDEDAAVLATWVDGVRYEVKPTQPLDATGTWTLTIGDDGSSLTIDGKRGTLATPADDEPTTQPADDEKTPVKNVEVLGDRLTFTTKLDGGVASVSLVVIDGVGTGTALLPDGSRVPVVAEKVSDETPEAEGDDTREVEVVDEPEPAVPTELGEGTDTVVDEQQPEAATETVETFAPTQPTTAPTTQPATRPSETGHGGSYEPNYPLGAFGRYGEPGPELEADDQWIIIGPSTVWTSGEAGVLEEAYVVIVGDRLHYVGPDMYAGTGGPDLKPIFIDGTGLHLTPGLIDAHAHIATDGGINESGQAVTCEVSIGDFIDPTGVNLYRQLAGGVTTVNVLHGSANPIGGRNAVLDLRWGAGPDALPFPDAPRGVKFALGENVK